MGRKSPLLGLFAHRDAVGERGSGPDRVHKLVTVTLLLAVTVLIFDRFALPGESSRKHAPSAHAPTRHAHATPLPTAVSQYSRQRFSSSCRRPNLHAHVCTIWAGLVCLLMGPSVHQSGAV